MSARSQTGAARRRLDADRWHFQHGPIDCIVSADGDDAAVAAAIETAWVRFQTLLAELVGELALLRTDLSAGAPALPRGPVARRMVAACRPHGQDGRFITAMAAVAGSVAEELLGAFDDPRIARASVNNGGDIAVRLAPGTSFEVGVCADPRRGVAGLPLDGRFTVAAARVDAALARGAAEARAQIDRGRIIAAVLSLQGRWRVVGEVGVAAGLDIDGAGSPTADPRLRDERAAAVG